MRISLERLFKSYMKNMDTSAKIYSYRQSESQTLWVSLMIQLAICTRFTPISGQDTTQPLPYDPSSTVETQVRSSFITSLRQLRTTYLDSYILHFPLETYAKTLEAWRVLIGFQDEGRVRVIGLSNTYDPSLLTRLGEDSGRAVQVVQNRWYERNGWDREVVEWCRANGAQYQ